MKDFFGKEQRPLDIDPLLIVLNPERLHLHQHLDRRFLEMMERGALHEVKDFLDMQMPVDHPLYKATGVTPLMRHIKGDLTLKDAVALAQQHTRHYAKRQSTWMKNQCSPTLIFDPFEQTIEDMVHAIILLMGKGELLCFA